MPKLAKIKYIINLIVENPNGPPFTIYGIGIVSKHFCSKGQNADNWPWGGGSRWLVSLLCLTLLENQHFQSLFSRALNGCNGQQAKQKVLNFYDYRSKI
jgi:hypothetical protein